MSKISFRAAESLGRFLGVCSFRILHQVVRVQMAWHRQRCIKHRDLGVGWLAHRLSEGIQTCTYCVRHGDLGTFVYLSALGCTLTVCVILDIYLINLFFFFFFNLPWHVLSWSWLWQRQRQLCVCGTVEEGKENKQFLWKSIVIYSC